MKEEGICVSLYEKPISCHLLSKKMYVNKL